MKAKKDLSLGGYERPKLEVPNKESKDLDYVKKLDFLEKTFNKKCINYQNQEDSLVCCN